MGSFVHVSEKLNSCHKFIYIERSHGAMFVNLWDLKTIFPISIIICVNRNTKKVKIWNIKDTIRKIPQALSSHITNGRPLGLVMYLCYWRKIVFSLSSVSSCNKHVVGRSFDCCWRLRISLLLSHVEYSFSCALKLCYNGNLGEGTLFNICSI